MSKEKIVVPRDDPSTRPDELVFVKMEAGVPSRDELVRWASIREAGIYVPIIRAIGMGLLLLYDIRNSLAAIAKRYE